VLGTRGSSLALIQADKVRRLLLASFPDLQIPITIIKTEGDIDHASLLSSFGGRGAFVRSIEHAILRHEIDAAVHSLKDLPSRLPEGLCLGAAPEREDPRDALISREGLRIEELPLGTVIATGSDRRRVQIRRLRPDITFMEIRGNIETRLKKIDSGEVDVLVLASAGLRRLGLDRRITQYLDPEIVLPAPCQGALGVECRNDDDMTRSLLATIDDSNIRTCVDTERAFIERLGMGCHAPIGCLARIEQEAVVIDSFVWYGVKKQEAGKNGKRQQTDENENAYSRTVRTSRNTALSAARELANWFRSRSDANLLGER